MTGVAAIFDVDGTLVRANVVDHYLFLVRRLFSGAERWTRISAAAVKAPYWLVLDRMDRSRFNESFYRSYRGIPGHAAARVAEACFEGLFARRWIDAALQRLLSHRERGERIVLVSGSLDFILKPHARHLGAEACLCPSLEREEESFSGRLAGAPMVGEEKAACVRRYAEGNGVDLRSSYAYGDSLTDVPVLEAVGHAAVVNPGFRLRRTALRRGWEIL
jgi:HAD superfamily hydrolase (TIGR01490 family)